MVTQIKNTHILDTLLSCTLITCALFCLFYFTSKPKLLQVPISDQLHQIPGEWGGEPGRGIFRSATGRRTPLSTFVSTVPARVKTCGCMSGCWPVCLSGGEDGTVGGKDSWRILCAGGRQQEGPRRTHLWGWGLGSLPEAVTLDPPREHQPSGTACGHPPLRSDSWI